MSYVNEKAFFEQFMQHGCFNLWTHGQKRPDLLYDIHPYMLRELLKKTFSFITYVHSHYKHNNS